MEALEDFESDTATSFTIRKGVILKVVLVDDPDIRVNRVDGAWAVSQWIYPENFHHLKKVNVTLRNLFSHSIRIEEYQKFDTCFETS